jgi:glycerophosphoryl diester phosphodiesterase
LADIGAPYDLVAAGSAITYADLGKPAGLADIASYAHGIGAAKELVIPRDGQGLLGTPTSLVRDARASGLKVHAWTFRAENAFLPASLRSGEAPGDSGALEEKIDLYLEAGIEGVFTDNPDVAVRVRTHREGRQ